MNKKAGIVILVQLISVVACLVICMILISLQGLDKIPQILFHFCDMGTLALLLVMALPPMLVHGVWKDFFRAFLLGKKDRHFSICEIKKTLLAIELLQKQIIYGTIMIACIQIIDTMINLEDISGLGPNLALVIGAGFYMAVALLFIEPLKAYVQRYLEDYLAEEEN